MKQTIYSYSRLTSWEQCKKQFYHTYHLKEKQEQNAWGNLGSAAHDVLEYSIGENKYDNLAELFYESLPIDLHFETMKEGYTEKLVSECLSFFGEFKGVEGEVLDIEREFLIDLDGHKLRGFIDLELKRGKDLSALDWKTSGIAGFKGKKLAEKERQLYIYAKAMKQKWGKYPKKLIFYMLRYNEEIVIDFSLKRMREVEKWAIDTIEEIESATEYPANPNFFFCKSLCGVTNCEHNRNYGA